jgi:hypothetical protein
MVKWKMGKGQIKIDNMSREPGLRGAALQSVEEQGFRLILPIAAVIDTMPLDTSYYCVFSNHQ